jgi:hypothetical protein
MPLTKATIKVTDMSSQRRNGNKPPGYSGRAAVQSEKCDTAAESWNSEMNR